MSYPKEPTYQPTYHILVAVRSEEDFRPLLHMGYLLAKAHTGHLTIVTVRQMKQDLEWLRIPTALSDVTIETKFIQSETPAPAILKYAAEIEPDLILVGWKGQRPKKGHLLGSTLDLILQRTQYDLAVLRADPTWPPDRILSKESMRILLPTAGGPNTTLAMDLATHLSDENEITALYVLPQEADEASQRERHRWLAELTDPWSYHSGLKTKVIQADGILKGVVAEAGQHDITLLGATKVNMFNQLLFGAIPHQIAAENKGPSLIVKQFEGNVGSLMSRIWWQSTHFLPKLSVEERVDVYKQIRRGARPKIDFFMMIGLSAGIAALGLLLDSPAVIIGAMLVAPLMSAIIGIGLGVIQADVRLMGLAASATLRGVLLAVGMGLLAGLLLPVFEPTSEILSRTRPSLFDLGVAIVSGLAGAYALCRPNVSSSLPGVAIAVALVPPLATVGIGLAWFNRSIAQGASVLFMTNLVAIIAAGGLVFFLLGFRPKLVRRRHHIFSGAVVSSAILLGVMAWVLWNLSSVSFRQARLERVVEQVLITEVPQVLPGASLDSWRIQEPEEAEDETTLNLEVEVRSTRNLAHQAVVDLQSQVAGRLRDAGILAEDQALSLVLLVIPTTALDPFQPPTATAGPALVDAPPPSPSPTPTATASPSATPSPPPTATPTSPPSPTPTATASPTATSSPTATASPPATSTAAPTFTPTPTPALAVVANTQGQGLRLRWTPGGPPAGAFSEGTQLRMLSERETVEGLEWVKVTGPEGRTGWVAAQFLVLVP